ncbi:hypothetical protein ACJX0J_017470, partial [Zea mays]
MAEVEDLHLPQHLRDLPIIFHHVDNKEDLEITSLKNREEYALIKKEKNSILSIHMQIKSFLLKVVRIIFSLHANDIDNNKIITNRYQFIRQTKRQLTIEV